MAHDLKTGRGLRRTVDWIFRDRRTGHLVVAQFPNIPLGVFLIATALRMALSPHGTIRTVIDVVAGIALVIWAVDEIVRGVNPFRRALGAAVLAVAAYGFLR